MTSLQPNADIADELSARQRVTAMVGVYSVLFLLGLETTIGGAILPMASMALDGFEHFHWTGTLQMLASACATPIAARIGDMTGRKNLLRLSIVLLCLAGIGSGLAQSFELLLGSRLLNGLAMGIMAATAFAVPADVFRDPAQRVRWQSIGGVMFAVACSIGPMLGGALSEAYGWRAALFAVPVVCVPVLMVLHQLPLRRPAYPLKQQFDFAGGALLCLFIVVSLLALQPPAAIDGGAYVALPILAVGLLALLWRVQRRTLHPILSLEILSNANARNIVLSTLLSGSVLFILMFYSPMLLTSVAGVSLREAATLMLPLLVGMPAGSVINGMLFGRQSRPQWLLAAGAISLLCGCAMLARLEPGSQSLYVLVSFGFAGVGLGLINQNQTLFIQMVTPLQHVGAATGLISTARMYGGALGSALLGIALASGDMQHALTMAMTCSVAAAALMVPLAARLRLYGAA